MPTYTVHEPPLWKKESASNPERFAFVRDGFHFWAFLLPPLWLIAKRLWIALILYVVILVALEIGMDWAKVPSMASLIVEVMLAIVIGFEAPSIQRWTLQRRKWKTLGFVVAEDVEMAERRFFAAWAQGAPARNKPDSVPVYSTPVLRGPPTSSDVIGLFPEPGNPSPGMPR